MTADSVGGVWTYALELSRGLTRRGVEVALATLGQPLTAGQWAEARAIDGLRVHESEYQLEWMDEPWDDVRASGAWLLELEARLAPDVVHLNGYCHGALPWRAPALVVAHSCVLSWWQAVHGEAAPERYARYHQEVSRGLARAQAVVAPSAAMLAALREHYGTLPNAEVIHNARDMGVSAPLAKEPFILAAGRLWDAAKNLRALDAVAHRTAWPVRVAGETRHPGGGACQAANAELLGPLPPHRLADLMARAGIFALPARYEPFGLSALEAGLAGCALVLGDIPSLREVWGDAALYVPPDDLEALWAALEGLARFPEARECWGERARARALSYSVDRQVDAYLARYAALTRAPAAPRALAELRAS